MSVILSPAQKAWETRRKNGTAPAKPVIAAPIIERNAEIELLMYIGISAVDGCGCLTGSFGFTLKGKPVSAEHLTDADRALLNIRLVSIADSAKPDALFFGHDAMAAYLSDASVSDLESMLPLMRSLDGVLLATREDSEDHSLPMAFQAVSWNLRVHGVIYDGTRTKRGAIYPQIEALMHEVLTLTADKPAEHVTA